MNIQIDSDALNNDQLAQVIAVLTQAAATAYANAERNADDAEAAEAAGFEYRECEKNARGAFRELADRIGQEEAADRIDMFGADPDCMISLSQPAPAPTAQEIEELREKWQIITATWA